MKNEPWMLGEVIRKSKRAVIYGIEEDGKEVLVASEAMKTLADLEKAALFDPVVQAGLLFLSHGECSQTQMLLTLVCTMSERHQEMKRMLVKAYENQAGQVKG
jgi:hypothetical protein